LDEWKNGTYNRTNRKLNEYRIRIQDNEYRIMNTKQQASAVLVEL
jgi:hypothetical protein